MPARSVFVTGIGIVSPAGSTAEATWNNLLAGNRYIRRLDWPWPADPAGGAYFGATAPGHTATSDPEVSNDVRRADMLAWAVAQAVEQAELATRAGTVRIGVCEGTSKIMLDLNSVLGNSLEKTPNTFSPLLSGLIPHDSFTSFLDFIRPLWVYRAVAACASGSVCIARGFQAIRDGDADAVICMASDASIAPLWMAAYERMGVLGSPTSPHENDACRPFDAARNGFAVGEGAAAVILEAGDTMKPSQNAGPLAELLGAVIGCDPSGLTQVDEQGESLTEAIRRATRQAGINPQAIQAIQAHGTATASNDMAEMNAFRAIFAGEMSRIPALSIKGAIGHLLGAAGAVELAVCAMAIRDQRLPGNINLKHPDPGFGGVNLPVEATQLKRGPILKTSLGFGGHLAALILGPAD